MENGPFIDDVPIKTSNYKGFSMAMLGHNQMVSFDVPSFDPAECGISSLPGGQG
jgi:hypothetical protein